MAIKSQGTTVEVDISSTDTVISETMSISPIGSSSNLVDSTHLSSTRREYIGGLGDGAEVTLSGNYVKNDAGQEYLRDNQDSTQAFTITYSNSDTAEFSGVILSWNVGPFEVEGKVPFESRVKISGAITWTEA